MRQAAAATEYIEVPVTVDTDPTGDTVDIAIVDRWAPIPPPDDTAWHAAEWKTLAANPYIARLLVGPDGGALELEAGITYSAVLRVTDNPEIPIRRVGPITAI